MVALALALAAPLPLAGCQKAPEAAQQEAPGAVAAGGPSSASAMGAGSSGLRVALSFDEQWQHAEAMVAATYQEAGRPFLVEPVGGGEPTFFTDYYFKVDEAFSGELPESVRRSGVLTVRQKGGSRLINGNAVTLQPGTRYLLSLYSIPDGSECNTEGDHFYLLAGGAWPEVEPGAFDEGSYRVTLDELRACDKATAGSLRPSGNDKESYLAEVEERYRAGEYSQGYYEALRAQAEAEQQRYARIMTPEEQRAYEEELDAAGIGMAIA